MNSRIARLRQASLDAAPTLSPERASLMTDFYQAHAGRFSPPVMRGQSFYHLCQQKTIYLGEEELIVGERGPRPKAVPTYPELTCHSMDDLRILDSRPKTSYAADAECLRVYQEKVIPYWRGRSMRDKLFAELPEEWKEAYDAGLFTEFMEQRAHRPHGVGRQDLPPGDVGFQATDRRLDGPLEFPRRPRGLRQA